MAATCSTQLRNMGNGANDRREKTLAEFFAGIGLMRMGLERQGWRVALAHDIDPRKEAEIE